MKFTTSFFLTIIIVSSIACNQIKDNSATPNEPEVAKSDPLFELISAEHSGISFSNDLKEDLNINIMNYEYYYNGGGVAIGDINNDGLPDIYFSGTNVSNRLYINKGNLVFEDITDKAGVSGGLGFKTGITMVDINGDGFLDIYVCKTGKFDAQNRTNLLYINNGDLTFTEKAAEYGLNDSSYSNSCTFFDYDLDGDLDMYLVNHPINFLEANTIRVQQVNNELVRLPYANFDLVSDRLYRNNGNNTFTDVSKQAGIMNNSYGFMMTITDINEDGYPDLYVSNDYIEPDFLYINNGNGTFTENLKAYIRHTSHFGMGVDIADYNNDGLMDIVVLDMIPEDNRRLKQLDNVMKYDRYQMQVKFGYYHQQMRNTLQLNNGNNSFSEIGQLSGISNTDWSWGPLFADFNNDGYKDLFVANGYRRDVTNLDYMKFTVDSINRSGGATVSDINQLLKLIPTEKLQNYIFENNKDLTFKNVSNDWGITEKTWSNGCAYADLDNDGDLDLVINNIDEQAYLYKNLADKKIADNHYLKVKLIGTDKNRNGIGAYVKLKTQAGEQIQYITPSRGFFSSQDITAHFGTGNQKYIEQIKVIWPDGKMQILNNVPTNQLLQIDYKNADQKFERKRERNTEVLFAEVSDKIGLNYTHKENEFVDFKREPLIPHEFSKNGPGIAVGDINGDGMEDVFVGGALGYSGALFIQKSNSTFANIPNPSLEQDKLKEDMGALFFDSDNDGDLDLYVVSGGSESDGESSDYQDRLYINDGKGNFSRAQDALPQILSSGSCVIAADYDKDGDLDLFVGGKIVGGSYPVAPQSYLLQNNNGKFTNVTNALAPGLENAGLVSSAIWSDYDQDGNLDLIVVGEWMPITIFRNVNGRFSKVTNIPALANSDGWWNSIISGDFDNDGDIDYVAGNLGLNSRLKASPDQPASVHYKDFDNNGALDAIICTYMQGICYPIAQRDQLLEQLRFLRKRFTRYSTYANATIENVFTPDELNGANKLVAKTFASSYIENLGNGQFKISNLPIEAQFSPVYGMVAEDLNKDGNLDVLLVGNNYSSDVLSGRYDAGNGLVLFGKGNGTFENVSVTKSGFYNPKNAKALARVRLENGSMAYLISNNNDKLQAFKTQSSGLGYAKLNKDDARAEIFFTNGKKRIVELQYGSGYLSSSGRTLTLAENVEKIIIYNYKNSPRAISPSNKLASITNR